MSASVSRRRFFASSAALAVSGSTLISSNEPAAAAQVGNRKPLRLGLMTYSLAAKWDIDTIIKNCTAAKFEHVELRTTHAHGVEVSLSKAERAEVRKRFEDSPLAAISLASAFSYHHDDPKVLRKHIEGTKEYTLLAHDLGALGIRVFPNSLMTDKGIPEEKTLEQIGKSLGEVGDFAAEYGVKIQVGVHGRGTDYVPRIRKMLDYSGSEHVYVNWNCSPNDVKGAGFDANFAMVGNKISNVHMHELWNEDYPYRRLFELLQGVGYKGFLDAEIPATDGDPVRLMKYYRALFLALQNTV